MGNKDKSKGGESTLYNKKTLRKLIIQLLSENSNKSLNYKQIAKQFEIQDATTKALIIDALYDLQASGKVEEEHTGKFKIKHSGSYFTGIIDFSTKNKVIVVNEENLEEVVIKFEHLNHALPGDEVKVCLFAKRKKKRPEGEVVEILKHHRDSFVGIIEISKNFAFLIPDNKVMPYDIFIPLTKLKGAENGQKAVAKITDWPERGKNPVGEITEVLGNVGDHQAEMHAILNEFELPYRFSDNLIQESEKISEKITDEEIARRRDFRQITTFTIDPIDAKDFDDALS
jgi:ribonuclease R